MQILQDIFEKEEQTFFDDVALDRAFGVVVALASEVYVLRDRLRALEKMLESKNIIDISILDEEPSDKERLSNLQDREEFTRGLMVNLLGKQQSLGTD